MGQILFWVILAAVIFILESYLYLNKVHLAFPGERAKLLGKWIYFIILFLQFGGMIFLFFYKREHGGPMGSTALQTLDSFVKVVFIVKLFFLVPIVLLGDLYLGAEKLLGFAKGSENLPERVAGRRTFIKQAAVVISALPFLDFLDGMTFGKYRFKLRRVSLAFDDLPEAFDGFRIAQFSDFHAGSFDRLEAVRQGLEKIQETAADVIVFTGDLVNEMAEEMDDFLEAFEVLDAPYGQYACTGNHDYGYRSPESKTPENLARIKEKYAAAKLRLLNNEHVKLEKDGQHIRLMGVENWGKARFFPKEGDLEGTLADVPEGDFKILLSHDPTHWDAEVVKHPKKVQLTLSGHTHGGQMGVEWSGIRWSPGKYIYKRWAGLYEQAGRRLYVNRGFGMLENFYFRAGIYPEITLFELKKS